VGGVLSLRIGWSRWALSIVGEPALPEIALDVISPGLDAPVTVVSDWKPGDVLWSGVIGADPITVQVRPVTAGLRLSWRGTDVIARVMSPRIAQLDALMPERKDTEAERYLRCPMPGLVVSILTEAGRKVRAGEPLAVVEAMKMENVLRAERDATVKRIDAKPGDVLAVDAVILEFE
jgi:propionyl-CoA carboxylase alpha chain